MTGAISSNVDIANLALAHLGKPRIVSLTQSGTEASLASRFVEIATEYVARASDWTFLREQIPLSQIANDRPEDWDFCYDYPSRALKFRTLADPRRPEQVYREYRLSSGKIYTDLDEARARYTTLEGTGPSDWSLEFCMAISAKMAELMAPSLTRRRADIETMRVLYLTEFGKAVETDAGQEWTPYDLDYSYVHGREGAQDGRRQRQTDGSSIWD